MPTINIQSNATTFEDLQTMVLENYKRTDKTTELKRALNETYREMVACIDPRKMKEQIFYDLEVGQEDYAIPDTTLRINHPLRLIDITASNNSASSYPMRFISKDEYDEIEPNPNSSENIIGGRPYKYCFYKNSILVTPVPDRPIYRIEMDMGGETEIMVAPTDATIFAPTWDETIKAGTLSRMYALIDEWDNADKWQTVYRYGFAGKEGRITGGLELLKKLNEEIEVAPIIVRNRDF